VQSRRASVGYAARNIEIGEVQAFGENVWFEMADLPCGENLREEPLILGSGFWSG